MEGNIVISVGLFGHSGDQEVWENMDEGTLTNTKKMLDDMHKRKDVAKRIKQLRIDHGMTQSEVAIAQMRVLANM
ncbi:MAG: hypothetical protein J6N21_04595 [Butyrivibrio sp.]|nr:hypothetical protein [Butyrivibrio sp.]